MTLDEERSVEIKCHEIKVSSFPTRSGTPVKTTGIFNVVCEWLTLPLWGLLEYVFLPSASYTLPVIFLLLAGFIMYQEFSAYLPGILSFSLVALALPWMIIFSLFPYIAKRSANLTVKKPIWFAMAYYALIFAMIGAKFSLQNMTLWMAASWLFLSAGVIASTCYFVKTSMPKMVFLGYSMFWALVATPIEIVRSPLEYIFPALGTHFLARGTNDLGDLLVLSINFVNTVVFLWLFARRQKAIGEHQRMAAIKNVTGECDAALANTDYNKALELVERLIKLDAEDVDGKITAIQSLMKTTVDEAIGNVIQSVTDLQKELEELNKTFGETSPEYQKKLLEYEAYKKTLQEKWRNGTIKHYEEEYNAAMTGGNYSAALDVAYKLREFKTADADTKIEQARFGLEERRKELQQLPCFVCGKTFAKCK